MTIQCQACTNWQPRKTDPKMVRLGMAVYKIDGTTYRFFGGARQRDCESFSQADAKTIAARVAFEERK